MAHDIVNDEKDFLYHLSIRVRNRNRFFFARDKIKIEIVSDCTTVLGVNAI